MGNQAIGLAVATAGSIAAPIAAPATKGAAQTRAILSVILVISKSPWVMIARIVSGTPY